MPGFENIPTDLTTEQAQELATNLNAAEYVDAYGNSWTEATVMATDLAQKKRLLYLLWLLAQAIG